MMMMEAGDATEPQREALQFDIHTDGLPPEMAEMMYKIKQVAESMLYHWSSFPIVLPESTALTTAGAKENGMAITLRDLFVAPNFDELEEVATDTNGELKKLTESQLDEVYVEGEFDVESRNFPGQQHRWRLSELIQKGTTRSRISLLEDAALSLRLLIITARNRFYSHFFSLSQSFRSVLRGMWLILDILIGMPSTTPGEISVKLREERSKHLIAELDCKPQMKTEFRNFCEFVRDKLKQLEAEKHKTVDLRPPVVPYQYQNVKGQHIDLRLFNRDLMKRAHTVLKDVLERESRGWFVQFKETKLNELRGTDLSLDEITERLNDSIMEEYLKRVFSALLASEDLESLAPKLGELLVEQAKSVLIMTKAAENIKIKMHKHREELKTHLTKTYSVKSRIRAWVNEQLDAFEAEFISQNLWCVHEESITKCRDEGLDQAVYFLHRDLNFMKEREPVLRKELSKERLPTRDYYFYSRIWFPSDWVVKRHLYSETEVIPTVIVSTPTTITAPRADNNQPTFTVEKYRTRKTTSRYPFWRWINYVQRTWAWTWSTMFWLGLVVPFSSPLGLRALLSPNPFMPDYELSQVNGALCPKPSSKTHTMISRLRGLWRHVKLSRNKFENEPDTGFLGKSFTRHVNRVWNYGCKGALGSVGLVLFYPTACLLVTASSLTVALFTPLCVEVVEASSLTVALFTPLCVEVVEASSLTVALFTPLCVEVVEASSLTVALFTPLCVEVVEASSLTVALFTPLWMPFITLFCQFVAVLFYDFDNPRFENNSIMLVCEAVVWRFLVLGLLQPAAALLSGFVCCPLASFFVAFGGLLRYGFRRMWDNVMFHSVIKRLGRVPSSDGFVARRVQGPGLASNFFYQIQPEQALVALQSKLELQQLNVWANNVKKHIEKPVCSYRDFIHKSFQPFSADLIKEGVFEALDTETKKYTAELTKRIDERKKFLSLGLTPSVKTKVKLTNKDIKRVLVQSISMVETFYPPAIFAQLPMSEERFWEEKQLETRDWKGLTCQLLSDIFSPGFLAPLEEADKTFRLEVEHLNLARYVEMMQTMEYRDDLSIVSAIHTPKGQLDIGSPFLEVSVFDPRRESSDYSELLNRGRRKWPWKRPLTSHKDLQKLEIPPPIPHPATIAIYIYNRQNDQSPIRADLVPLMYKRIMRAAEKTPYIDGSTDVFYPPEQDEMETSTPDHTTTSDPDITVASHLAVQERAFSEDSVRIHIDSTDSDLHLSAELVPAAPPLRRSSDVTPHSSSNEGTLRAERRADSHGALTTGSLNAGALDDSNAVDDVALDDIALDAVALDDVTLESGALNNGAFEDGTTTNSSSSS